MYKDKVTRDGEYYIDIFNGIVTDKKTNEDVSEVFKDIDLHQLGKDLGLDINGDFIYVVNGVIMNMMAFFELDEFDL